MITLLSKEKGWSLRKGKVQTLDWTTGLAYLVVQGSIVLLKPYLALSPLKKFFSIMNVRMPIFAKY